MGCEYVRRKWDVWKKGQVTWPRRWHCRALTRWDWNCDKYQYKLWVRTEYIYKEFRINMPVWCWCFSYLHPGTGIDTQPAFKPLNLFSIGDNPLPKTANQFHPGTLFSMQGTTATTTLSQAHPPPPPQWDTRTLEREKDLILSVFRPQVQYFFQSFYTHNFFTSTGTSNYIVKLLLDAPPVHFLTLHDMTHTRCPNISKLWTRIELLWRLWANIKSMEITASTSHC